MSIVLKTMTAVVGLAVAAALCAAIWYAAHDNGLVIEPFSVPPDMAQRGLTVSCRRPAARQARGDPGRNGFRAAAGSYTNNWGDDIKVQIPETGVSIGQFYGLLVTGLGARRTSPAKCSAPRTAFPSRRGGGDGGAMVTGSETDLDKLLQQTAEAIYKRTQPYRYAIYAEFHARWQRRP